MKKTIAIPVDCPPEDLHRYGDRPMTGQEIAARQAEEAAFVPPGRTEILAESPDGQKWKLKVDNNGKITTKKGE